MTGHVPGNYIDGEWLPPDATIPVVNPADHSVIAEVGYGGKAEAAQAASAASRAFPAWSSRTARQRADILVEASRLLGARADEIGRLLSRETGKRLPEGIGEVRFAAEYFRWFAEEARRPVGAVLSQEVPGRRHVTLHRAAGVVACLTPWNFPVSIPARKLAPALAAGCTTVLRVSEKAPLAAMEMVRCLVAAGVPGGVLNIVLGPAAEQSDALLSHEAVRVVSFTGSTSVGRHIMSLASRRIVRPLLELGGDAAFIVFDDADVNAAVEGAMLAKFRNNGQSCIAANRFFVHDRVFEEFRDRFAATVDAMSVGEPLADPSPDLGPLIDDERVAAVRRVVEEAEAAGARRITRRRSVPQEGSYLEPVLLEDVPDGTALSCQEVFGPAAALFRFSADDDVIRRANDTEMGLAAYFYTRDVRRAWRVAEGLEAGIIGCNNPLPSAVYGPMGGVKQSGLGREGSDLGLDEFREISYVTWEL
jgi:succinate-semialdehyde dehydrogenase / glutarate-semialdehyde dehydrogenase